MTPIVAGFLAAIAIVAVLAVVDSMKRAAESQDRIIATQVETIATMQRIIDAQGEHVKLLESRR